jgi:hypothetical protein
MARGEKETALPRRKSEANVGVTDGWISLIDPKL